MDEHEVHKVVGVQAPGGSHWLATLSWSTLFNLLHRGVTSTLFWQWYKPEIHLCFYSSYRNVSYVFYIVVAKYLSQHVCRVSVCIQGSIHNISRQTFSLLVDTNRITLGSLENISIPKQIRVILTIKCKYMSAINVYVSIYIPYYIIYIPMFIVISL